MDACSSLNVFQLRQLLLRIVNLGDDRAIHTTIATDTRKVSFAGRPFSLERADEFFSRLADWGFTLARSLASWKSIEHAGPVEFDHAYPDYLREVIRIASTHEINVYFDFHKGYFLPARRVDASAVRQRPG